MAEEKKSNAVLDFISSIMPKSKAQEQAPVVEQPKADNFAQRFIKDVTKNVPIVGDYINNGVSLPQVTNTPGFVDGKFTQNSPAMNQQMQSLQDIGTGVANLPRNLLLHPIDSVKAAVTGPIEGTASTLGAILQPNNQEAQDKYKKNIIGNTLSTVGTMTGIASKTSPVLNPSGATGAVQQDIPQQAVDKYMEPFRVKGKTVAHMSQDPQEVARAMMRDNVVGNMDDLAQTADDTTHALTNINKYAVGKTTGPIDMAQAKTAAFEQLKSSPDLAERPAALVKYNAKIQAILDKQSELSKGFTPGRSAPTDAYTAMQELKNNGYKYLKDAYDDQGSLISSEKRDVGNAYISAANELQIGINDQIKSQGIIDQIKSDPYVLEQLSKKTIPQAVKDRFVNEAKDYNDVSHSMQSYVNLGKMVSDTKNSAYSYANKLVENTDKSINNMVAGALHLPPIQLVTDAIGEVTKPVTQALTGNAVKDMTTKAIKQAGGSATSGGLLPEIGRQAAAPINFVKDMVKNPQQAIDVLKQNPQQAAAVVSAGQAGQDAQRAEEGNQPTASNMPSFQMPTTGTTDQIVATPPETRITSVAQLPKNMADIKPDQAGNFSVASPYEIQGEDGQTLALSPSAYQQKISELEQQKGAVQVNDPQQAATIQGQINALEKKAQTSEALGEAYQKIDDINQKLNDSRQILAKAPVNLLTLFPTYDKLMNAGNPEYARLAQNLQYIEAVYPPAKGNLFTPSSSDVMLKKINTTNQELLGAYYKQLNQYVGGVNKQGQTTPVGTQLPVIAPQAAPPKNINFNGGGMAPLPPIQ